MDSALVLTGIDGPKQLLAAAHDSRPTYVLADLRELAQPYPAIRDETDAAGDRRIRVGDAVVLHRGSSLTLEMAGSDIDRLRAAAAAVWGAGVPIYALDVAPELYS